MKEYTLLIYESFSIVEVIARAIISITCLYVLGTNVENYNSVVVMGLFLLLYIVEPLLNRFKKRKLLSYAEENENRI